MKSEGPLFDRLPIQRNLPVEFDACLSWKACIVVSTEKPGLVSNAISQMNNETSYMGNHPDSALISVR